ncbi:MAG: hypothetical protein HKM04_00245 [Legionellales bacterium]|nr:hypothetical protein [Legionellales bacterium]
MLSIERSAYFVPDTRFVVQTDLARFNINAAQAKVFTKIYGLNQIPYAKDISVTDLIEKSVSKLFVDGTVRKQDIKFIIHAHTAKVITRFGQSVIREVKSRLGLLSATAFGTSLNNCASTLNAFEMAAMLLTCQDKTAKAIIVTGEMAFTPTVQVIPNTSITGDAAAAVVVSLNDHNNKLLALEINTYGKYSRGIWLSEEESKDFEKRYVPLLGETINKVVEKTGLSLSDIKMILPHNVNLISWAKLAKHIDYPLANIYLENISKYGHCFGADILINFTDVQSRQLLNKGDYYLMVTVGLGATFAAAVFKY